MYSLSCCSCTPDNRGLITLITVLNSMVIQRKLIIVQVLIWISNCKISVDIMLSYTSLSTDHARFAQVTADSLYMLLATKRISSISVPFLIVLCMQVTQLTELIATSSYPDLPTEGNVRSFAKKRHLIKQMEWSQSETIKNQDQLIERMVTKKNLGWWNRKMHERGWITLLCAVKYFTAASACF